MENPYCFLCCFYRLSENIRRGAQLGYADLGKPLLYAGPAL